MTNTPPVKEVGRTRSEFHMECECGHKIVSTKQEGRCEACGIAWVVRHPTIRHPLRNNNTRSK